MSTWLRFLLLGWLIACRGDRAIDPNAAQLDRLVSAVACGQGDKSACARNLAANRERCRRADTQGCVLLGITLTTGNEVAKDEALGVKFFEQACNGNDANGCWYLGSSHEQGRGVPADPARALAAYQKGCDLGGDVNACHALAAMHIYGRATPIDKSRALEAYDRGCAMKGGRQLCELASKLRAE